MNDMIQQFVEDVNERVEGELGLSVYDLPDFEFYDYYEDGLKRGTSDWLHAVDCCFLDLLSENLSFYE